MIPASYTTVVHIITDSALKTDPTRGRGGEIKGCTRNGKRCDRLVANECGHCTNSKDSKGVLKQAPRMPEFTKPPEDWTFNER